MEILSKANVELCVKNSNPIKIHVLVVDSKLLGFDILLRIDIIKQLGGVYITELGKIRFFNQPICAAIEINELDFGAKFNQHTKVWTASWKWLDRHPHECLKNSVPEYTILKEATDKYQHKLQSWLENG